MDKVFFVVTVSRQVEGEMVSVKFEKVFRHIGQAEQYVKELAKVFTETIQVPGAGPVQFLCERGLHEMEVQE